MKIAAIVTEYNPFHHGHAYQIAKTRRAGATHIVAIMSGNFLQRGSPAVLEKHERAQAALQCGVDLVLELPLPHALATAERFATGAVRLAQALGCVDLLSFGAEDTLDELRFVAHALSSTDLQPVVQSYLRAGRTYAAARQLALADAIGSQLAAIVARPNNILAVEYLKAAHKLGFAPQFYAVARKRVPHDSPLPNGAFASASHLRSLSACQGIAAWQPYLPAAAFAVCEAASKQGLIPLPERLEQSVLPVLRRLTKLELATLPELSEGLENRLLAAVRSSVSLEALYGAVKTKRYPLARIRRMVWNAYLGVTEADARTLPPYLRVLGMNRAGVEILSTAKRTASLPLSSSLAKLERVNDSCARFAYLESRSTDLFTLSLAHPLPCGYDYTCKPLLPSLFKG